MRWPNYAGYIPPRDICTKPITWPSGSPLIMASSKCSVCTGALPCCPLCKQVNNMYSVGLADWGWLLVVCTRAVGGPVHQGPPLGGGGDGWGKTCKQQPCTVPATSKLVHLQHTHACMHPSQWPAANGSLHLGNILTFKNKGFQPQKVRAVNGFCLEWLPKVCGTHRENIS